VCSTGDQAQPAPVEALPENLDWRGEVLPLEPVDSLSVLMVCDNSVDALLPDQGPARRLSMAGNGLTRPARTLAGGQGPDVPLAQHGFSALVEVRKGSQVRQLLFDTGVTPDGCVGNLRRLGRDPASIEAIVCSHGHFDHTIGLSGLVGTLGRADLPVLIHPEFWTRRRLAIPGRDPFEVPTTSRRALEGAGFEIVEQRQPSFLFDRSVLITGEVDRGHPASRRARGLPPERRDLRADHRRHGQRPGEARPGRDRARALHRLEGHPRDRRRPARLLHPEQRRHHAPVHRPSRLRAPAEAAVGHIHSL
jgi:Metallo-beta-lactamase superfamily